MSDTHDPIASVNDHNDWLAAHDEESQRLLDAYIADMLAELPADHTQRLVAVRLRLTTLEETTAPDNYGDHAVWRALNGEYRRLTGEEVEHRG